jgi:preprotein translocase subunit SecA
MITSRIESAQKAVEAQNFEARKHLLEYDDVMNKQREAVYGTRHQLLEGLDQKELILEDYVANLLSAIMEQHAPEEMHPDQWDLNSLKAKLLEQFGFDTEKEGIAFDQLNRHELGETLFTKLKEHYEMKEQILGGNAMRFHERMIMLSVLDGLWKDHLLNMDHLKEGIGLRGYGQQDPLVAYKKESFDMFEAMMNRFQEDTVRYLFLMQIVGPDGQPITRPPQRPVETPQAQAQSMELPFGTPDGLPAPQTVAGALGAGANGNGSHPAPQPVARKATSPVSIPVHAPSTTIDALERDFKRKKERELEMARNAGASDTSANGNFTQRRTGEKVGPNAPCPCGSGKKYKKCHGA